MLYEVITMWVGNGFYRQIEKADSASFSYDIPKTIVRLNVKYKDGQEEDIVSDESWYYNESPRITSYNVCYTKLLRMFDGDTYFAMSTGEKVV